MWVRRLVSWMQSRTLGTAALLRQLLRQLPMVAPAVVISWTFVDSRPFALAPAFPADRWGLTSENVPLREVPSIAPPPPDDGLPEGEFFPLPDLQTLPPTSLEIRDGPGGRVLRFSNTVWNDGEAPLELHGEVDTETRRTRVVQRVTSTGGAVVEWPVGEFVWHPTHTHWHLAGFAVYELWSIRVTGEPGRLVASSDKVSFCLIDTGVVDGRNPLGPAGRVYYGCGRGRQGLSVGWGDTYRSYLDGQSLPLGQVGDGLYALVSTTNPNGALRERDYSNNTATLYLAIHGDEVSLIERRVISRERCLTSGLC